MMKNILLLVLLSSLMCETGITQNPFQQMKMEYWDSKNGMPNEQIGNVYQTQDGFIWMTGFTGLVRFDGVNFKSYNSRTTPSMKTDEVVSLLTETEDGTLWIPTNNSGLLAYKNGAFTSYLTDYNYLRFIGKSKKEELLIQARTGTDGYILFDTNTKTFISLKDSQGIDLIIKGTIKYEEKNQDQSGNLWHGLGGKLYRIKDGIQDEIDAEDGISADIIRTDFFIDSRDRVWLATRSGLFIWNEKKFIPYPGMEGIQLRIIEDRNGGIWAVSGSGIAYLASESDRFAYYPDNVNALTLNVNNIMEDREGNLWFSSTLGLIKLSQSKFINYSAQDGLAGNRIEAVCALNDQNYLVATKAKLFIIENGLVRPYKFKNKRLEDLKDDPIHIIKDSNQNIWLCYRTGKILRISQSGEKLFLPKFFNQGRYVYECKDGNIWFGLPFAGIGFLNDKDEIELLDLPKVDFENLLISSIRKLMNNSWLITTFNKGVEIIDESGSPTNYDLESGLLNLTFFMSYEDEDGAIWLTSSLGITRIKNGVVENIDFRSGLPDNAIFNFLPDNEGYVWLTSNIGLIRAKKQELNDYLGNKIDQIDWKVYDEGDGMINRQCVGARHTSFTPDGRLLVPSLGGLIEIDPKNITTNEILPSVVIHQVLRDDIVQKESQSHTFEPGNHRYIFEYSGLSLVAPEKVEFKFKLNGYDKEWIIAKGDRKAYYTNIPSGEYTFQVIASNNDGVWNNIGDSYSFTITPFFFETAWFRILSLMALSLFIWGLINWRTSAARKRSEELETEVASRTTDLKKTNIKLGQSLENLKSTQSQLIQSEKMASLGELTAGIAHEIQNPLNFVNNFSEVSGELIDEMNLEIENGDLSEVKAISSDIKQNLEKISHHGQRASSIVKGMLDHSRSSSGEKVLTDINQLADEYLRLSYHGLRAKDSTFNAKYETTFDESLPKINIVPQDIGRVILNLINNAFQATQDLTGFNEKKDQAHKDVTDSIKQSDTSNLKGLAPKVVVTTKNLGNKITISVADNGPGIPDEIKDKIFQPFFTTKPTGQGTGLGLSLSYDIVKAHGGELVLTSSPGEGSTFTIQLPKN